MTESEAQALVELHKVVSELACEPRCANNVIGSETKQHCDCNRGRALEMIENLEIEG